MTIEGKISALKKASDSKLLIYGALKGWVPSFFYCNIPGHTALRIKLLGKSILDPALVWGIKNRGVVSWEDLAEKDWGGFYTSLAEDGFKDGVTVSHGNDWPTIVSAPGIGKLPLGEQEEFVGAAKDFAEYLEAFEKGV